MIVNILNNKTVWRILALMSYAPGAGYTRNDLMKAIGSNNLSLDRALDKLFSYGILRREARTIRFETSGEAQDLLAAIESDKRRLNMPSFDVFIVLADITRYLEPYHLHAFLFGSVAKKTARAGSDIDIAVIGTANLVAVKDRILQEHGRDVQFHHFKQEEKSALFKEVMKHGVRLI